MVNYFTDWPELLEQVQKEKDVADAGDVHNTNGF